MAELSELYARDCIDALAQSGRFEFTILYVTPDGLWRMPEGLDSEAIAAAKTLSFAEAMSAVSKLDITIGLPQMFCHAGMTSYRALFDLIGVPYLGNAALQMGLTANKAYARLLVADAGVAVPEGAVIRAGGAVPEVNFPVIVKPVAADNSDGVTLVRTAEDLPAALAEAFAHCGAAIIERYISPGREMRCGIISTGSKLLCMPPEEYPIDLADHPIRTKADKLTRSADGSLHLAAKNSASAWIVKPADPVIPALHAAARKCYAALGCRQYGLFDFRIDEDGTPWFLEAGLYCSFSPKSVIAVMAAAAGIALDDLFATMIASALNDAPTQLVIPPPLKVPPLKTGTTNRPQH
jgi:D-alanine-D-alanine ligase